MSLNELQTLIASIYPSSAYMKDYTLATDAAGNGSIALWNNSLGPQPTIDQLNQAAVQVQLARAQAVKIVALQDAYTKQRYGAPVTITGAAGQLLTFPSDPATQQNVVGYLCAYDATDWPGEGVPLQDASGGVPMVSYADVKAIAKAIAVQSQVAWTTLQSLIAQIKSAAGVEPLNAINWPEN